jgi:hypothetical protein
MSITTKRPTTTLIWNSSPNRASPAKKKQRTTLAQARQHSQISQSSSQSTNTEASPIKKRIHANKLPTHSEDPAQVSNEDINFLPKKKSTQNGYPSNYHSPRLKIRPAISSSKQHSNNKLLSKRQVRLALLQTFPNQNSRNQYMKSTLGSRHKESRGAHRPRVVT